MRKKKELNERFWMGGFLISGGGGEGDSRAQEGDLGPCSKELEKLRRRSLRFSILERTSGKKKKENNNKVCSGIKLT